MLIIDCDNVSVKRRCTLPLLSTLSNNQILTTNVEVEAHQKCVFEPCLL